MDPCPICDHSHAKVFFESKLPVAIRSDWTQLPVSARIYKCETCHHLYKPTTLVREWSDYQQYVIQGNAIERDKIDFSQGRMPEGRSMRLLNFLKNKGFFKKGDKLLDFGCNRGAFLALLKEANHYGFDLAESYRTNIEKLGCTYLTPRDEMPESVADVIVLIHVLEHLIHPGKDMETVLRALKPEGHVLVQVPHIFTQPTDIYVMDHQSHFTKKHLEQTILEATGRHLVREAQEIIGGELTVVVGPNCLLATQSQDMEFRYTHLLEQLSKAEDQLLDLYQQGDDIFLYGAGLLGSFCMGLFGDRIVGVIDDQMDLRGAKFYGHSIGGLTDFSPAQGRVLVAVPPIVSKQVSKRALDAGFEVSFAFAPID